MSSQTDSDIYVNRFVLVRTVTIIKFCGLEGTGGFDGVLFCKENTFRIETFGGIEWLELFH